MTKIIGHRGWRGKYPENSLEGFKALHTAGVDALELDIVVSKNNELIVSHEAWFDHTYCLSNKKDNLYQLSVPEIQEVDCGSKPHPRFLEQKKSRTFKPTLKELVALWKDLGSTPFIALEVKSESELYGSFQPFPEHFAALLVEFEKEYLSQFSYFVQSFDALFLKTYHQINGKTKTGLLVESTANLEQDLDFLAYQPEYYNPEHVLLNDVLVKKLKDLGIKTTTWTVNTHKDFNRLKDYELEGIITDFPEKFS